MTFAEVHREQQASLDVQPYPLLQQRPDQPWLHASLRLQRQDDACAVAHRDLHS